MQNLTTETKALGFCRVFKKVLVIVVVLCVLIALVCFIVFLMRRDLQLFRTLKHKGAIVTNGLECAKIGRIMIYKGGSVVDAAIAALFCEGITNSGSMGIGGGFLMNVYERKTKTSTIINAKAVAPASASETMFHGKMRLATQGGLSVAVPGELRGYWMAHQKFGKLPWETLIEPNIQLCLKGHYVTPYLAELFKLHEEEIHQVQGLREHFINPETNNTYQPGSIVKRTQLAETLRIISKYGADALYDGMLTEKLIEDITEREGTITWKDMKKYMPLFEKAIFTTLPDDLNFYSVDAPGSGSILAFILNILSDYLLDDINTNSMNWHRIAEAFKFAFGARVDFGDPNFVPGVRNLTCKLVSQHFAKAIRNKIFDFITFNAPTYYTPNVAYFEDHGTGNVIVLAPNGDAVVVTSAINYLFGSGLRSESTGIILNNEMHDFSYPDMENVNSVPPYPNNYIKPGKRSVSSMSPSIITNQNGDVVLAIGSTGGSKIPTSIAQVIIRKLWYNQNLRDAIAAPLIHHQLYPMILEYEENFDKKIIAELVKKGHKVEMFPRDGLVAITAIAKEGDKVEAEFDLRRGGKSLIISNKPVYYRNKTLSSIL